MLGQRIKSSEMVILPGSPEVELLLRPTARARRLSLRVSRLDGRVTMSVPMGTPRREAMRFAQERAGWIRDHLSQMPNETRPQIGGTIPFLGQTLSLTVGSNKHLKRSEKNLILPAGAPDKIGPRVMAYLKHEARGRLDHTSRHYARAVGRDFGRLTIRDTRSRWGSCSAEGNLMYSWRLVMAPEEVLEYVAAHEVSHLVHMDHSPAFWAQVEAIFPTYRAPRKWLRDHGSDLHRYRFRD